jgi:hypothetical protein
MIRYTALYLRAVFGALTHPLVRPYFLVATGLLVLGTCFYAVVEGWRPLDAAYFSVVTLATVGYGDLSPRTDLGKLFTMFYIVAGLGVLGTFVATITKVSIGWTEREEQHLQEPHQAPLLHTNAQSEADTAKE